MQLNQGDYIDETDNFSFYLESDSDCGDVRIDITDIPFKLIRLTEIKHKYIYVLDYNSLQDYFQSQKFRIDSYSKEIYCSALQKKIWFYRLFVNYPIGRCDILLIENTTDRIIQSFSLNINSSKINEIQFDC